MTLKLEYGFEDNFCLKITLEQVSCLGKIGKLGKIENVFFVQDRIKIIVIF